MVNVGQASLMLRGGPNSGMIVALSERPFTLGRRSENDLVLNESMVSRRHALIMKTAVSVPDPVFEEAEELARRLGTSRSALYTRALSAFLEAHRDEDITARMNRVCAEIDTSVDPVLAQMQALTMQPDEDW